MAGKTKLNYKELDVTKEVAFEYLKGNVAFNRKQRDAYVNRYSMSMLDGMWEVNGQDILIGKDSKGTTVLLNGQHRLLAVIKASETKPKISIKMGFKFDVPIDRDTFETIDANLARTTADFIAGEDKLTRGYAGQIAAAIRLYYQYRNGGLAGDILQISPQHLVRYHRKNPQIQNNVKKLMKDVRLHGSVISSSSAAFLLTIFSEKDKKLAERFMTRLLVGEDLKRSNPVFQAREILVKSKSTRDIKFNARYKLRLCIEAWNMVRKNTRGKKLECPETFPEVV